MKKSITTILFFIFCVFCACNISFFLREENSAQFVERLQLFFGNKESRSVRARAINLTSIPTYIYRYTKVENLTLSNNRLKDLPSEIKRLSHLETLNIDNNSFVSIPTALSELNSLTSLDISSNQLSNIDFSVLPAKLKYLFLDNNNITEVSDDIYKFKDLKRISAKSNRIVTVSNKIFAIPELLSLELSHNNLKEFDVLFHGKSSLKKLDLRHNKIRSLPLGLAKLQHLETLHLSNNQINNIPDMILSALTKMQTLDISHNQVSAIPASLGNLKELQHLTMSFNCLETLPDEIINLEKLIVLDIRGNNIKDCSHILQRLMQVSKCMIICDDPGIVLPESFSDYPEKHLTSNILILKIIMDEKEAFFMQAAE